MINSQLPVPALRNPGGPPPAPISRDAPVEVSPGVTDMRDGPRTYADTAEAASTLVVRGAEEAAKNGTFGVGGALLGPDHEVVAVVQNKVIQNGVVKDPTAHAERQLVDWYYEQVHRGAHLPPPSKMTIVTSLDPCMMCCGATLAAGFQVVIPAVDTFAGVNCHQDAKFTTLPKTPQMIARHRYSYLGVDGERPFVGPNDSPYAGAVIPAAVEKRSLDVFGGSLDEVKRQINAAGSSDVTPADPQELLGGSAPEVLKLLRRYDPDTLRVRVDPNNPGPALGERLVAVAKASRAAGNALDAAALVDPFGNVMLVVGGQESHSRVRIPFMELTRAWAKIRAEAGDAGKKYLPHIKDCKVVTMFGPGSDTLGVMELGAYGSSVEGPLPVSPSPHWQYVIGGQPATSLREEIAHLPPLYSQVIKEDVAQVRDRDLIGLCWKLYAAPWG